MNPIQTGSLSTLFRTSILKDYKYYHSNIFGGSIKTGYKGACIQVYLNEKEFIDAVKWAEKVGKRRVGLFLKVQRKGRSGLKEPSWNTKGIAKSFKLYFKVYKENEAERLSRASEIARKEKELAEERARLGI